MNISLNVTPESLDRIVSEQIQLTIRNIATMYDYGHYPDFIEKDLAALSRVYQYYTGREAEQR